MTIISPSLLACNFLKIQQEVETFNNVNDLWIHLDIMDGHFVPNLTFGPPVISKIHSISNQKLDAHLMVNNPEDYIDSLSAIGIYNYTFHWESVVHHDRLISEARKSFKSIGISINPSTPLSSIPDYIFKKIDLILIMSVNPGFGGQSFIDNTYKKISDLHKIKKENGLSFQIQVDGGVNDTNAKKLISLGATNLVAGSFIFNSDNYTNQIEKLR